MLHALLVPHSMLTLLAEAAPSAVEEKAPPVIDIDGTVVIQFAIFVVMYLVLRRFLFEPYMAMRKNREAHIDGVEKKARDMERRRESMDAEYQQRLQKARSSADDERAKLQVEGRAREAEVLGQARTRAQERIVEAQRKISAQVAAAQAELEKQAVPLAKQLAQRLLGREV